MEKLSPERGNSLIRQFPEVDLEFSINQYLYRCDTRYVCISETQSNYGMIMNFPGFVELSNEKRKEERDVIESLGFFSALFNLVDHNKNEQLFELNILNYSGQGLGLLVTENDLNLLNLINPGDRIPGIILFAESALITLTAKVRHKKKIEIGEYKDNYILGLESNIAMGEPFENLSVYGH